MCLNACSVNKKNGKAKETPFFEKVIPFKSWLYKVVLPVNSLWFQPHYFAYFNLTGSHLSNSNVKPWNINFGQQFIK